jgi:ABC-type multidrug transport system ATPase subunit
MNIMNMLFSIMEPEFFWKPVFSRFNTSAQMDAHLLAWPTNNVFGGIQFHTFDVTQKKFNFTLLYNATDSNTIIQMNQILTLGIHRLLGSDTEYMKTWFVQTWGKTNQQIVIWLQSGPYLLSFGLSILVTVFTQVLVEEKEKFIKDQLLISGVSLILYWMSRFISDIVLYIIVIIIQLGLVGVIGQMPPLTQNSWILIFCMYVSYGGTLILFSYLLSFFFKRGKDSAQWVGAIVGISIGLFYLVIVFVLNYNVPRWVNYILSVFPMYSLFYGLSLLGFAIRDNTPISITEMFKVGYSMDFLVLICILILETTVLFGIVFLIEFLQSLSRRPDNITGDRTPLLIQGDEPISEDVITTDEPLIEISRVSKTFGNGKWFCWRKQKTILENINFSIPRGECFGLLGPNGAGKTTLINIMSGRIGATSGSVSISGHDIYRNRDAVYQNMSICPQEDRLWDNLTPSEHIRIFSWIRNKQTKDIDQVLKDFELTEHLNKYVSSLSGGAKRKLSVALAFIGKNEVVLLDEPSASMDATMKRSLWNEITKLREGRVIILTTHNMEEADALCSTIGILVNGNMQCLGSTQFLKNKFGGGYNFQISVEPNNFERVVEWVNNTFPGVKVEMLFGHRISFEVPVHERQLSDLFELIETHKSELQIIDYTISQTTLEQVFLNFAKDQVEEK